MPKSFKDRAMQGFAKHGIKQVKVGKKVLETRQPTKKDYCKHCGQLPGFDEGCPLCNDPDIWRDD
jgi:hypothetical protein